MFDFPVQKRRKSTVKMCFPAFSSVCTAIKIVSNACVVSNLSRFCDVIRQPCDDPGGSALSALCRNLSQIRRRSSIKHAVLLLHLFFL